MVVVDLTEESHRELQLPEAQAAEEQWMQVKRQWSRRLRCSDRRRR